MLFHLFKKKKSNHFHSIPIIWKMLDELGYIGRWRELRWKGVVVLEGMDDWPATCGPASASWAAWSSGRRPPQRSVPWSAPRGTTPPAPAGRTWRRDSGRSPILRPTPSCELEHWLINPSLHFSHLILFFLRFLRTFLYLPSLTLTQRPSTVLTNKGVGISMERISFELVQACHMTAGAMWLVTKNIRSSSRMWKWAGKSHSSNKTRKEILFLRPAGLSPRLWADSGWLTARRCNSGSFLKRHTACVLSHRCTVLRGAQVAQMSREPRFGSGWSATHVTHFVCFSLTPLWALLFILPSAKLSSFSLPLSFWSFWVSPAIFPVWLGVLVPIPGLFSSEPAYFHADTKWVWWCSTCDGRMIIRTNLQWPWVVKVFLFDYWADPNLWNFFFFFHHCTKFDDLAGWNNFSLCCSALPGNELHNYFWYLYPLLSLLYTIMCSHRESESSELEFAIFVIAQYRNTGP